MNTTDRQHSLHSNEVSSYNNNCPLRKFLIARNLMILGLFLSIIIGVILHFTLGINVYFFMIPAAVFAIAFVALAAQIFRLINKKKDRPLEETSLPPSSESEDALQPPVSVPLDAEQDLLKGVLPRTLDGTLFHVSHLLNNEWTRRNQHNPQSRESRGFWGERKHRSSGIDVAMCVNPFIYAQLPTDNSEISLLQALITTTGESLKHHYEERTTFIFIPEPDAEPIQQAELSASDREGRPIIKSRAYMTSGTLPLMENEVIYSFDLPQATRYPSVGCIASHDLAAKTRHNHSCFTTTGFSQFIIGTMPSTQRNPELTLSALYRAIYQLYINALNAVKPDKELIILTRPSFQYDEGAVDRQSLDEKDASLMIEEEVCLAAALQAINDACHQANEQGLLLSRCNFRIMSNIVSSTLI
ncbi:MAG: hypothetical protein RSB82_01870 [Victivallaceae bacterium]